MNEESLKIARIDPRDYFRYEACKRCGFPPCRRLMSGGRTVYGRDFLIIHCGHYNTLRPCPFATGSFEEAETFFNRLSIQDINNRISWLLNDLHVVERLRYPAERCLTNWADFAEKIAFLRMLWRDRVFAFVRVPFRPEEKIRRWMGAFYESFSTEKTVKERQENAGDDSAEIITTSSEILGKTLHFPIVIAESKNKPGYDRNKINQKAADMEYGNYTIAEYKRINLLCRGDDNIAILPENRLLTLPDDRLFWVMRDMATKLFSIGDLENNIIKMIDHFKENSGMDFRSDILNREVRKHPSMQKFVQDVNDALMAKLNDPNVKGDVTKVYNLPPLHRANFSSFRDTFFGGLKIAVNDTMAYLVELLNYSVDGSTKYSGKIKVSLYDHFGLDRDDIENKKPGELAGFRSWFILQHVRGYRPFITIMENQFEIQGEL